MGSIGEIFDLDWSEGCIIDAPILIPVPGHLLQKPSFCFLYFKVYIFGGNRVGFFSPFNQTITRPLCITDDEIKQQ